MNMKENLKGKRIAILATNGFEESELKEPRKALHEAGACAEIVSPGGDRIRAWAEKDWGDFVQVDVPLDQADPEDYDALLLPGGVMNPDHLRMNSKAVDFVRHFFDSGKPVAAICHGPWMLVEADVVDGRRVTSWPSVKTDLRNAGGKASTDGNRRLFTFDAQRKIRPARAGRMIHLHGPNSGRHRTRVRRNREPDVVFGILKIPEHLHPGQIVFFGKQNCLGAGTEIARQRRVMGPHAVRFQELTAGAVT
jgi:protease I